MSSPISYDLQGQGGGKVLIADGNAANVRWVQCITDCSFNVFTSSNLENSSELTTVTVPAGVGIGGRIEYVEVNTGLAIAYYL
jgi:hypothetical protein